MLMRTFAAIFSGAMLLAASSCAPPRMPNDFPIGSALSIDDLPTVDMDGRPLPVGSLATVYFFAGPECPISRAYSPELARLAIRDQERGISWIMLFSEHDITADLIRTFQREYSMPLPSVIDRSQRIACIMGARIIPSVVVLDAQRNIMYRGRIDDRYQGLGISYGPPTKRDLASVVDAIAAGHPLPPASTAAVGCILPPCAQ